MMKCRRRAETTHNLPRARPRCPKVSCRQRMSSRKLSAIEDRGSLTIAPRAGTRSLKSRRAGPLHRPRIFTAACKRRRLPRSCDAPQYCVSGVLREGLRLLEVRVCPIRRGRGGGRSSVRSILQHGPASTCTSICGGHDSELFDDGDIRGHDRLLARGNPIGMPSGRPWRHTWKTTSTPTTTEPGRGCHQAHEIPLRSATSLQQAPFDADGDWRDHRHHVVRTPSSRRSDTIEPDHRATPSVSAGHAKKAGIDADPIRAVLLLSG